MSTKKVVRNLETAITRICEDIKEKKGGSGADKLDSLAKLVNAYSRLIERDNQKKINLEEDGDPMHYTKIASDRTDRSNVIR